MSDIMFAGLGGQGILTAGKILIEIAAKNGKNVCWTSEYSAEMRGGFSLCRVVISDEDIGSPYPDLLDVLCCMTEEAYEQYISQVRPQGTIIINRSIFRDRTFPEGIQVYGVDAMGIAAEVGSQRGLNLVMLGAMIKATGMIDERQFAAALSEYFEKKGKGNPKNLECFTRGCEKAVKM